MIVGTLGLLRAPARPRPGARRGSACVGGRCPRGVGRAFGAELAGDAERRAEDAGEADQQALVRAGALEHTVAPERVADAWDAVRSVQPLLIYRLFIYSNISAVYRGSKEITKFSRRR